MLLIKNLRSLRSLHSHINRISPKLRCSINSKRINETWTKSAATISINRFISTETKNRPLADSNYVTYQLDQLFRNCDTKIRRFNIINKINIENLYTGIINLNAATPSQALFILQCCGNLLCSEATESREKLVSKIWESLLQLDVALDINHYNALLQVLIENRSTFSPLDFLATLQEKNVEPNRITFSKLIEKYCQDGNIEGANEILSFMKSKELGIRETIFNSLILGNSRANDLEGAISILEVMKESHMEPVPETYAILLQVYAEHENKEEVINLLRRYDDEDIFIHGSDFLNIIYNLAEQGKTEFIPEILSRVKQMASMQFKTMNISTRLIHKGQYEVAHQIFKSLPFRADEQYMWNFYPKELARSNMSFEKIIQHCEELKHSGQNILSYENALEGFLLVGNIDGALAVMKIMNENNCEIRTHYFFPIFSLLKKNLNPEKNYEILEKLKEFSVKISGLLIEEYIFPCLVNTADDIDTAFTTLNSLGLNIGVNYCYSNFLCGILKIYGIEEAANFANKFRRAALHFIKTPLLNQYVINFDAKNTVCVLRQMLPESLRTGKQRERSIDGDIRHDVQDFICNAINYMINKNMQEEHLADFLQALLTEGIRVDDRTFSYVSDRLGSYITMQQRNLLEAVNAVDIKPMVVTRTNIDKELDDRLFDRSDYSNSGLLHSINNADANNILEVLENMKSNNKEMSPKVGVMAAQKLIETGNVEEAEKLLNTIKEEFPDFQISDLTILRYCSALVKADRSQDVVKALMLYAPENGIWPERFISYADSNASILLKTLCEANDLSSLQLIQEALINKNYGTTHKILSYLTKYHLDHDDVEKAFENYMHLLDEYKNSGFKSLLFKKLIVADELDRIQQVLDKTSSIQGETSSIFSLVFAFIELGKLRHAQKLLQSLQVSTYSLLKKFDDQCRFYAQDRNPDHILSMIQVTKDFLGSDRQFLYSHLLDVYIKNEDTENALNALLKLQEEDIIPNDEFLIKLGKFLLSKNCQVPFAIPNVQITSSKLSKYPDPDRKQPTNVRNTTNDTIVKTPEDIKNALISGQRITVSQLKFILNQYVVEGDVNNMELIAKYIDEKLSKRGNMKAKLAFAYLQHNRFEEYMDKLFKCADIEEPSSIEALYDTIPNSVMLFVLKNCPENFPQIEKYCIKIVTKDNRMALSALINAYLVIDRQEEAAKLYNEYFNDGDFFVRSAANYAYEHQQPQIIENCLDLIKNTENNDKVVAYLLSTSIAMSSKNEAYDEALKTIEDALSRNLKLSSLNNTGLNALKTKMTAAGLTFPHDISPEVMKAEQEAAEPSSSSSSDEDEKK